MCRSHFLSLALQGGCHSHTPPQIYLLKLFPSGMLQLSVAVRSCFWYFFYFQNYWQKLEVVMTTMFWCTVLPTLISTFPGFFFFKNKTSNRSLTQHFDVVMTLLNCLFLVTWKWCRDDIERLCSITHFYR